MPDDGSRHRPVPLSVYIVAGTAMLLFALYVWWRTTNGYSKKEIEQEKQKTREKAALLRQRLKTLREQGNSTEDIARLFGLSERKVIELLDKTENEIVKKTLAERLNESLAKEDDRRKPKAENGVWDKKEEGLAKPHQLFKNPTPFAYYRNFVHQSMTKELHQAKLQSALWGWSAFVAFCATIFYGVAVSLSWTDNVWYLWILFPLLVMILVWQWVKMQAMHQKKYKEHLVENGRPATARLVKSEETDARNDSGTVMKLYLELTDETGETWQIMVRKVFPPDKQHLLQPGTVYKAWYLPQNRKEVIVDGLDWAVYHT